MLMKSSSDKVLAEQQKQHFFLGRQAIYDPNLEVVGYELLYRRADNAHAGSFDGDVATSQVLLNTILELGLHQVVGSHDAFFNLTRNFIVQPDLLPLPDGRMVLEILEDVTADEQVVEGLRTLKKNGYRLALDDFVLSEQNRPLLDLVDIVKVDLRQIDGGQLPAYVETLKSFPVQLLAEKVETYQELEHCKELGFQLYQGFFLCKPKVLTGHSLAPNRLAILSLLAELQGADADVRKMEQTIGRDVSLSYKLLRLINSAQFNLPRKVDSLRQAVVILGNRNIFNWVSLIAMSVIDDKPSELMVTSLVRAKMCQAIGDSIPQANAEILFLVGLFSTLDALLDAPLERVLSELPLSNEVSQALLQGTGLYGQVLNQVLRYERGEWGEIDQNQVDVSTLSNSFLQAVEWTEQTMKSIEA